MRYQDRSLEELRTVITAYIEGHTKRHGHPPDTQKLKIKLEELAEQKEADTFYNMFEQLSAVSIRTAVMALNEVVQTPPPKDTQNEVFQKQEPPKSWGMNVGKKNKGTKV